MNTRRVAPTRLAVTLDNFPFGDDILLDEAALTILDAEEPKCFCIVASVQSNL